EVFGRTRSEGSWGTTSTDRSGVYILPPTKSSAPPKPIVFQENGKLDLLLLIDGTSRVLAQAAQAAPAPNQTPNESTVTVTWESLQQKLLEFSRWLRERYPDLHSGCIAFGDATLA